MTGVQAYVAGEGDGVPCRTPGTGDGAPGADGLTHRAARQAKPGSAAADPPEQGERLHKELAELRAALATQPVIDLAGGIVMAVAGCTPREAWEVLVDVSQHTNVKLRDVCGHLVDGVAGPPPPPRERLALGAALRRLAERTAAVDSAGQ
ncbi:ANTAR domain-containing protein [Streptomyces sp. NPDC047002]|uniref:ANTAR domain-containing protein n=1 Tax=Streptomyces sp. NPDC047002 TaxID=3155475 RepID=UPI003451EF0F